MKKRTRRASFKKVGLETLIRIVNWPIANRKWFFSGIGVFTLTILSPRLSPTTPSQEFNAPPSQEFHGDVENAAGRDLTVNHNYPKEEKEPVEVYPGFVNTYTKNGGEAVIGAPSEEKRQVKRGIVQVFKTETGESAIVQEASSNQAYLIEHVFWNVFQDARVLEEATAALGYPTSEAYSTAGGQRQNFRGGAILINPDQQAFAVYGGIGGFYLNDNDGEQGKLGFPISREEGQGNGVILQHFEHGTIRYAPGERTRICQPPTC